MFKLVTFVVILSASNVILQYKYLLEILPLILIFKINNESTKWVLAGCLLYTAAAPEPCKILLLFSHSGVLLSRDCQIVQIPPPFDCVCKCSATAPSFLHSSPRRKFPPFLPSLGYCQYMDSSNIWNTKQIRPLLQAGGMGAVMFFQDRIAHALLY